MDRKEQLIEKYRQTNVDEDNYWAEYTVDEFVKVCRLLGIPVAVSDVSWSISYSQGDGASFSPSTHYLAALVEQAQAWVLEGRKEYCTAEGEAAGAVVKAADVFAAEVLEHLEAHLLSADLKEALGETHVHISQAHSVDVHSGCMSIEVGMDYDDGDDGDEMNWLLPLYRGLADALHTELVNDYEYQTSDEQVWESITAMGLDTEDDDESDTTETTEENEPCCA